MIKAEIKYDEYGRRLNKDGKVLSEQTRIPQMDDRGLPRVKINKKGQAINSPNSIIKRLEDEY